MKTLSTDFVQNADKSGKNRFLQIRREKDIAIYRRETIEGSLVGFEVFRFKTIQEGAKLPGGLTVSETYESYPGGKAFGRNAWFFGGVGCEERATQRFAELVQGKVEVVEPEEVDTEELKLIPVLRVVSSKPVKSGLKFPEGEFSQKELAAFNGFDNYKVVYSDLQKFLTSGVLVKGSQRNSARGKPAQLFKVA